MKEWALQHPYLTFFIACSLLSTIVALVPWKRQPRDSDD